MSDDLTIIHGDTVAILPTLAPRSIQCVVTSPPYYGLRDYGLNPTAYPEIVYQPMPGLPPLVIPAASVCLGLEQTPEAYTAHLVHVFRLVRDALATDGVAWLNLGDSYSGGSGTGRKDKGRTCDGRPIGGAEYNISQTPNKRRDGIPAKNILGIPFRVAFALQADGWIVRTDVVWHKPNAMPDSTKDRPTKDHEYVFLLAKQPRYYFDQDAIAEPCVDDDYIRHGKIRRSPDTRASVLRIQGGLHRQLPRNPDTRAALLKPQSSNEFHTRRTTRNKRTVWTINTKSLADAHFAAMPELLAEPCILAGSRIGDTVLDPFGGSGTTARVALKHGRRAISIDLNPDYISIQERRTNAVQRIMERV